MEHSENKPIETIKLSDRDKVRLVEAINKQSEKPVAKERRNLRVSYHGVNVVVKLIQQTGEIRHVVVPRNLSRGGLAFIHGRFVYPDTEIVVSLPSHNRDWVDIPGKIVRCRHVKGIVHEVSVTFDQPINVADFVGLSPEDQARYLREAYADDSNGKSRLNRTVEGEVLIVDDSEPDRRLLKLWLQRFGLHVTEADDVGKAIDLIKRKKDDAEAQRTGEGFDALLVELRVERRGGAELIQRFRESGFRKTIVALSADGSDANRKRASSSGCDAFIEKPFDPARLLESLSALGGDTAGDDASVTSTLAGDPEMAPLLRDFVRSLGDCDQKLRKAAMHADGKTIRSVCEYLKGSGAGYGFDQITRLSKLVLDMLEQHTDDLTKVAGAVTDLTDILRRVRPATATAGNDTPDTDAAEPEGDDGDSK